LYSWQLSNCTANSVSCTSQNQLTTIAEDGSTSTTSLNAPGQVGTIQPVLQRADSSYIGTVQISGGNLMLAFTSSGQQLWSQSNDTPQVATSDGGVIGSSGTTYDENGYVRGQTANLPVQSWTGFTYQLRAANQIAFQLLFLRPPLRSGLGEDRILPHCRLGTRHSTRIMLFTALHKNL